MSLNPALLLLPLVAAGTSLAGDYGKAIIDDKAPVADSNWCGFFKNNTLYEGEGFVKSVKFKGRYHGQWISQSEDTLTGWVENTNGYHEFQHRRLRLGLDIEVAHNLTLSTLMNIPDGTGGAGAHGLTRGPFFDDWNEFKLIWDPSDDFQVILGKQKQKVTREFTTSSNAILTVERSVLTNATASDYPWGAVVGFKALGLDHEIGAWIAGADRDITGDRYDWPDFDSRGGAHYGLSHEISDATTLYLEYMYTNNSDGAVDPRGSADTNRGSAFEHVAAFGSSSKFGRFGLLTDLIFGQDGIATGDLPAGYDTWGIIILPSYDITEKLQFVTRYVYMAEGREQRPQRYDVRQSVEDYHTFYAGFNYYFCGNNLKLMSGYEYATGDLFGTGGDEVRSGTWMLALRTSW